MSAVIPSIMSIPIHILVYLGHVITIQFAENADTLKRRNDFVGQVNSVLSLT